VFQVRNGRAEPEIEKGTSSGSVNTPSGQKAKEQSSKKKEICLVSSLENYEVC